ncbi:hypothetical protein IB244_31180 [Rhizobium sp. RHZ02]|uniref:hypothetical protein n=1 Tax=Rhizobium sp. RHZ02 TaxID=2769306 RepID=UPI00177C4DA3|nr:hypothetical protein [Rhizobium sp. RHZ02]MBD9455935.1 hypothetical protein [Rhizobium sp. RHZ02]
MTVPDDIHNVADDIWIKVAADVYDRTELTEIIGRAILSERNRCAVIARNWQSSSHQDEQYAANSIADKIMAGER